MFLDRSNKRRLLDLTQEAGKVGTDILFGELSGTEKGYRDLTAPEQLSPSPSPGSHTTLPLHMLLPPYSGKVYSASRPQILDEAFPAMPHPDYHGTKYLSPFQHRYQRNCPLVCVMV